MKSYGKPKKTKEHQGQLNACFLHFFTCFATFPVGWPPSAFCGPFACICNVFPHFEGDLRMRNVYVKRGPGGVPTLTSDPKSLFRKNAHLVIPIYLPLNGFKDLSEQEREARHICDAPRGAKSGPRAAKRNTIIKPY